MRVFRAVLFGFLLGNGASSAATAGPQAPPAPAAPDAPAPSVDSLIADLSSENYKTREDSTRRLWAMGEVALEDLKKAAAGEDPEAAFRASNLIRNIEHFITPDTDPQVIELVERYMKSKREDKAEIIGKIRERRGWHQILRLYASETDPLSREELRGEAHTAAIIGAREKLIAGKPDEARRFLELAPRDAPALLALAAFHRANGTLDEELRKAEKGPADWRAALARVAGNTVLAESSAREAGDELLAAAMGLFNGNFLPWLELQRTGEETPARKVYMRIVADQWSGKEKEIRAESLAPLVEQVTDARDEERTNAANMLFLLGQPALGEPSLGKSSANEAVGYYASLERIHEALAAFGLDPDAPDYNGWVAKKFESFLNEKRFDNDRAETESIRAERDLLQFAALLSQFGLQSESISAFEGPMLAMADSDAEGFTTFLGNLFSPERGLLCVPLAQKVGAKWAGEDPDRWRQLITLAFNDDETVMQWWDWMPGLDPEASVNERFDGILGLFDYTSDPGKLGRRWLDLAWKATEKATPAQRPHYLKRIAFVPDFSRLGGRSADMATTLRVLDMQEPEERENPLQTQSFMGLSMLGRWDEVIAIFEKMIAGNDGEAASLAQPHLHAYLASSLRRAGREEEAKVQDGWVEKLSLGDRETSLRNSSGYAFGGDLERAAVWLSRSAIETPTGIDGYEEILGEYATSLLEKGRWKESAALAEAVALRASGLKLTPGAASSLLEFRLKADLPRALSLLQTDREQAIRLIGRCHALFPSGGLLADYFFPALRKAGLTKEHDEYFEASWKIFTGLTRDYPNSERLHNGSAWVAARASRHLAEAEKHSKKALELNPDQAAYLDTMAEIQFAKRDRKAAVKWSAQAVNFDPPLSPSGIIIRRQYERFTREPFPEN